MALETGISRPILLLRQKASRGMSDAPTTYTELAEVIASIPVLIRDKRRRDGLSLREAGRQLDVSFSSVKRWEAGEAIGSTDELMALLRWLGDARREVTIDQQHPLANPQPFNGSCVATPGAHERGSREGCCVRS